MLVHTDLNTVIPQVVWNMDLQDSPIVNKHIFSYLPTIIMLKVSTSYTYINASIVFSFLRQSQPIFRHHGN